MSASVLLWRDAVLSDAGPRAPLVRLALLALARYMDEAGLCWPSLTTLSAASGLGRSSLCRQLARAEAEGWVTREHKAADRSWLRTEYQAALPATGGSATRALPSAPVALVPHEHYLVPGKHYHSAPGALGVVPQGDGGSAPGATGTPHQNSPSVQEPPIAPHEGGETETMDQEPEPERLGGELFPLPAGDQAPAPSEPRHGAPKKRKTALAPTAEESAWFARWYALVPRKVKREQALVSFVRCSRGHGGPTGTLKLPSEEKLAAATRGWAERAAQEASEPRFIAHPSTWLNAAGFDDEEGVTAGPTPEELAARRAAKAARDEETKERITREAEESYMREWRGQEGH